MYSIAIIDDNLDDLNNTYNLINDYCFNHNYNVNIQCFDNPPSAINILENFDVLFLDIDMPNVNGIDLAATLSRNIILIFITNYDNLVFDAFRAHPYDFIRKAYLETQLPLTLNSIFKIINKQKKYLALKIPEGKLRLPLNEIIYCEIIDHITFIYTIEQNYQLRKTLKEVIDLIPSDNFFKINRSYYINLSHIKRYNRKQVTMSNDTVISIGEGKYNSFEQHYLNDII